MASAPRVGRDGGSKKVIWVFGKPEYFFKWDWTDRNSLIRLEKLDFTRNPRGSAGYARSPDEADGSDRSPESATVPHRDQIPQRSVMTRCAANGQSADPHRLRGVRLQLYRARKSRVASVLTDGICRNHRQVGNVGAFGRHCS